MAKEFTFRGKSLEELQKLETREFAKLLGSREKRSVLRGFEVIENFVSRNRGKIENGKTVKTHLRQLIVVPRMVGMSVGIHNGKEFVTIKIIPEMVGHRLGEFASTRKKVEHGSPGIGATKSSAGASVK